MYLKLFLSFILLNQIHRILSSNFNSQSSREKASNNFICYYGSWSKYRPEDGKFLPQNIDPNLCTHIIYSFAGLSENKIKLLDSSDDNIIKEVGDLRKQNPNLKTLIAIGGWNEGSTKYSQMVSNIESRKVFIDSVIEMLEKYNYDGLDIDWEYPAKRGGSPSDKENFVKLLRELRQEFNKKNLILTGAFGASNSLIESSYDIPGISENLDFINLMTYDYNVFGPKTGHNAPFIDIENTVNSWINNGVDRKKLILGIPTYGHSFTLANSKNNNVGSSAISPGLPGPYTRQAGMLGYNEICTNEGYTTKYVNDGNMVPYAYLNNQWISYDDPQSVHLKATYAKYMGLGGAMVWSIETDDFRGKCGEKYPLLNAIKDGLN